MMAIGLVQSATGGIRTLVALIVLLLVSAKSAYAYVGPGLGVGVVASILGLISGLLMLLFGAVWYPLKKLYGKMRAIFFQ